MKDARYTIPKAALLSKVLDLISDLPMEKRDTNGDLYEYLLSKIASAGTSRAHDKGRSQSVEHQSEGRPKSPDSRARDV